jgi:hypothetical protein
MDCNICAETKTNFVTCSECKTQVCCTCAKSFLLTQLTARCMQCKTVWSEIFVRKSLPLEWVEGEYKIHCKNILLDLELSYIPSTMDFIPIYKGYHESKDERYNFMKNEYPLIKAYKREISDTKDFIKTLDKKADKTIISDLKEDVKLLQKRIVDINIKSESIKIKHINLEEDFADWNVDFYRHPLQDDGDEKKSSPPQKPKHVYTIPCGETDCKGFLNSQFNCQICSTSHCNKCRVKITSSTAHVCHKEDLKSLDLIKSQTKPCPKCFVRITKTAGCDHMFCTACKTSFNWKTNKIISHNQSSNPLLWQWVSAGGEGTQGIRSDMIRDHSFATFDEVKTFEDFWFRFRPVVGSEDYKSWYNFKDFLTNESNFSQFARNFYDNIIRSPFPEKVQVNTTIREISDICQKIVIDYNAEYNKKLRCRYILNQIDKKTFSTLAMKAYKELQYKNEIALLLQDLRSKLIQQVKNTLISFRDYFNELKYKTISSAELNKFIRFDNKKYLSYLCAYNYEANTLTKLFGYTQIDYALCLSKMEPVLIASDDTEKYLSCSYFIHFKSHKVYSPNEDN